MLHQLVLRRYIFEHPDQPMFMRPTLQLNSFTLLLFIQPENDAPHFVQMKLANIVHRIVVEGVVWERIELPFDQMISAVFSDFLTIIQGGFAKVSQKWPKIT